MIDIITVVVPHVLMAIAIWRLLGRDDLDNDPLLPDSRRQMARNKAMTTARGAPAGGEMPGA